MSTKRIFRKQRYDADCYRVLKGDQIVGLLERMANNTWRVYGIDGAPVSQVNFLTTSLAMDWLRDYPERLFHGEGSDHA